MTVAVTTRAWCVGRGRALGLDQPRLMGILNVTPDSFSDGGELKTVDDAVARALRMIDEGAQVIDVGGESTRPGAASVPVDEQIRRTVPAIEALRATSDVLISIDTTRAAVARAALDAGADIINDTAAGLDDDDMLALAAERGCGIVLMHRRARPASEQFSHQYDQPPAYDDVVVAVRDFLRERARAAEAAGVASASIVIDPGLGFGKTVRQNFELIARTGELVALGYPVLGAASRKSFVGAAAGIDEPRERAMASAAVSVLQYWAGVRLFRVHDVDLQRQALAVTKAAADASKERDGAGQP